MKEERNYESKTGYAEEIVSATFDRILALSNLGLKRDESFIKNLSNALRILINIDSKLIKGKTPEFSHPFIAYEDFETKKAYAVFINGIDDTMFIKEIASPGVGKGKSGFAIGCMVDAVEGKNTCILQWPDSDHYIENKEFLALLSNYGFAISGSVSKEDVFSYNPSDTIASALLTIMNQNAFLPKRIGGSDIKIGIENILTLNMKLSDSYAIASDLLMGLIDITNCMMYYIVYNEEDGIVTLVSNDPRIQNDNPTGDIYIVYRNADGNFDSVSIESSVVGGTGSSIPFMSILKSMTEVIVTD